MQNRLLNGGGQFPEKTFEPLDDVEKKWLVHFVERIRFQVQSIFVNLNPAALPLARVLV